MKLRYRSAILATLSVVIVACGPVDGPTDKEIATLVKQSMAAEFEEPGMSDEERRALRDVLERASVTTNGTCSTAQGRKSYVCLADVTIEIPGNTEQQNQSVVIEITKGGNGVWMVTD